LSEDLLIPVSLVKQYHFCPRIVYFSEILGVKERVTELMKEGKDIQRDEERKDKRRKTLLGKGLSANLRIKQLHLSSKRLSLEGIVDLVNIDEKICLVERKAAKAPKKIPKNHLYQLVAYALLVEETLKKPLKEIIIHYIKSDSLIKIEITYDMKKHVIWTIDQIKKILEKEYLPPYKWKPACKSCGYKWICKQT